jgi:putative peptide zinc metalloprotease protein
MTSTLFSASWYRVAELKPRLRTHVKIHRHDYRGRVWHVLDDPVGGRVHRFSPEAYQFIGLLDGQRSIDTIWQALQTEWGDSAPTQNDVVRLLSQLHTADALITEAAPDSLEVFRRFQKHEKQRWKQRLASPLAIRIPVLDPERFLEATYPAVSWIFSRFGAVIWLVVVLTGMILAAVNWGAITDNIVDRSLAPANLFLLWLVYPFVKAIHELGHGYAIKKAGGEVHDIGIMLLVLIPVPYVDATSTSGFRDKKQRMLVGAAGIMVEMFLAAVALLVWLVAEPGAVHAVAYNVMLIGGVSTLLFNGNPLLRFDGYYVLQDGLEIPNLGTRSNRYLGYLIQRYLFGIADAVSPADALGERIWFVFYGIAAFCYRMFIMTVIILYISGRFFGVGVILAAWASITMIGLPVVKHLNFLFSDHRTRSNRGRSISLSGGILAFLLILVFLVPVPDWTLVKGVIWPQEESQVRAGTEGFISDIKIKSGSMVQEGQALLVADDPLIRTRLKLQEANREELESQLKAAQAEDIVQAGVIKEALKAAIAAEELTLSRMVKLTVLSPRDGIFVLPFEQDLSNTFIAQGQVLGYVLDPNEPVRVRVAINQDHIGHVREQLDQVHVMTSGWGAVSHLADSVRLIPGGSYSLPSPALGTGAGGEIPIDPSDSDARTTLARVFELEVTMGSEMHTDLLGQRVNVRLDHGFRPLGFQLVRSLQQLFLGLLDV